MKASEKAAMQRTAIVVWVPIIVCLVVYGIIYLVMNARANHAQTLYTRQAQVCAKQVSKENAAALAKGNTGNGVAICPDDSYNINHGTLGLPVFEVNGVPDNSGSY